MKRLKNKNVSKKVKNGTLVLTRDEFLIDNNNYKKTKHNSDNKLYRSTYVVDSNRDDELALIKIHSGGKKSILNKAKNIEKYNAYVKTKDNEGRPIKLGKKFKRGNPKYDVTEQSANAMKKEAVVNHKNKQDRTNNIKKLRTLKGRKKK